MLNEPAGANDGGFLTLLTLSWTVVSEGIYTADRVIVMMDELRTQLRDDDVGKDMEHVDVSAGVTSDGKVIRTRPDDYMGND